MKKLLFLITMLAIGALACSTTVTPEPLTGTPVPTETETAVPPTTTPTPEPLRVVDGAEVLTGSWVQTISPIIGEGPVLNDMFVLWKEGSGTAGFEQSFVLANGHNSAACHLSTGVEALESSAIVTSRLLYRIISIDKNNNKTFYLNSSFYEPGIREFYFTIESDARAMTVFVGVEKDEQEDYINYKFSTPSLICFNNVDITDETLRR